MSEDGGAFKTEAGLNNSADFCTEKPPDLLLEPLFLR